MALRLYDTATRAVRPFVPLVEGRVGIYLCGATVQAPPHVGHLRASVTLDVLHRWLARQGVDVVLCRNVTDIDDKILHNAAHEGVPFWRLAARHERAFAAAYDAVGCLPPAVEPRATGHIPEMVALLERLLAGGHAYAAAGDVYFDVASWPAYGELSGQRPADMVQGESAAAGKRSPVDFTLWKGAKPGEPAWDTPWGPGRPGWHLECSAMATRYLGPAFDIHAGGLDLVFPHHENELAQSRAAGDPFARYWLHNGLVTTAGEKMSKSLGNSLLVDQVLQRVRPVELRYYLAAPHYRSALAYSEAALAEAAAAYRRLEGFVQRAGDLVGPGEPGPLPDGFVAALDDDLAVPAALALTHAAVRDGNAALAAGDKDGVRRALAEVRGMLDALGLDPLGAPWSGAAGTGPDLREVVDRLVELALEQRAAARARGDYAAADALRATLAASGVQVEDTPTGPRWSLGPR